MLANLPDGSQIFMHWPELAMEYHEDFKLKDITIHEDLILPDLDKVWMSNEERRFDIHIVESRAVQKDSHADVFVMEMREEPQRKNNLKEYL